MPRQPARSTAVAREIDVFLKRFEADPLVNAPVSFVIGGIERTSRNLPYFRASCHAARGRVYVRYVCYQGTKSLTLSEAERYLAWMKAGNVGKHHRVPEDFGTEASNG